MQPERKTLFYLTNIIKTNERIENRNSREKHMYDSGPHFTLIDANDVMNTIESEDCFKRMPSLRKLTRNKYYMYIKE